MTSMDLFSTIGKAVVALASTTNTTNTTVSGATIDTLGYESLMILYKSGAYTNGTNTPNVQESDDDTTWTELPADQVTGGTEVGAALAAANIVKRLGVNSKKRYVRVQSVSTGTSAAGHEVSAIAVLGHPTSTIYTPTAQ